MERLTRFGISHNRFTVFIMIAVLLIGTSAYFKLSKREDPAITIRTAVVSASFPGMDPERIENLIADPLERTARRISEVEDINTLITTGSAVLYLDLYESLPKHAIEGVFQEIRNKMNSVAHELPQGTQGPHINTDYGDVEIATIAVTGDGFNYAELKESAKHLRKKLYTVNGIGRVTLYGVQEERIWLDIDSRKLATTGIQLPTLLKDLQTQNVILSSGDIDAAGTTLTVEVNGDFASLNDIEEMITQVEDSGTLIHLQDLITVRRGYEEPATTPVFFNGQPAIVLGVQMSDGQDIQVLGERLHAMVAAVEQTQPLGISYDYSTWQEADVTRSINEALVNVLQTAAVVLIVLMIFLGIRPALIVACIVPFSVMFTMTLMGHFGIELHVVSIAAVIISLGLLVDNGLVIVEDIQTQIARGMAPADAATRASKQFGTPLAVASITTVAAFIPLFLVEGTDGEYGFALGAVVALMLVGSWLTAMYLLPALCVWLSDNKTSTTAEHTENKKPSRLVSAYSAIIERVIKHAVPVTIGAYIIVIVSTTLFDYLKNEMFPLSARNQYLIYLDMPKGTSITRTQQEAEAVEQWLLNKQVNPEVKDTTVYVGDGGPRFYLALNPADTNPSSAFILVNTYDFEGAIAAAQRTRRWLFEQHPAASAKVKHLSMGGEESGIVEVKFTGPDADKLLSMAKHIESSVMNLPGVIQNENDWGNKVVKIIVNVAQDRAREHGVTSRDISRALESYLSGATVSEYREGNKVIPIMIRATKTSRDSIEDLEGITIPVNGQLITLDQIATFEPVYELSQLRRENQERTIKVSVKSTQFSAFDLMEFLEPVIAKMDFTGGYSVEFDGEIKDSEDVNQQLLAGLIPALLVMFAAIMYQFNSVRRVALIFMTIPLILVGSPLGLLIAGQPYSFFGTLGLISLAGIIINNAIVLIDQIDIERQQHSLKQAIIIAAQKRVTPITLTTLTTVVGLLPMGIAGGALFEPMATLMIGGLFVASIISLLFVPAAFYLLFRREPEPLTTAS